MVTAMIVCCYGNFDWRLRSVEEMAGYNDYLKGIAALIEKAKPDYVVLCGGHTNPNAEESEAASVLPRFDYLERRDGGPKFLLEECSTTTPANLDYGFDRIIKQGTRLDQVTIVCDRVRKMKVKVLSRRLFGSVPWNVVAIKRKDIHPHSTWLWQAFQTLKCLFLPRRRVFP